MHRHSSAQGGSSLGPTPPATATNASIGTHNGSDATASVLEMPTASLDSVPPVPTSTAAKKSAKKPRKVAKRRAAALSRKPVLQPLRAPQPLGNAPSIGDGLSPQPPAASFSNTAFSKHQPPPQVQPENQRSKWIKPLLVFLLALLLLEATVVLIYWSVSRSQEELADEKFRGMSEYVSSRFVHHMTQLAANVGLMASGFQALTHPESNLNRVTASYMISSTSSLVSVSVWSELVQSTARYEELLEEFGYSNMTQRQPRLFLGNGSSPAITDFTSQPRYIGVYFSDVPISAPRSIIDADQRIFVDVSQEPLRKWAIDNSLLTGKPYATKPTPLVVGSAGFSIFKAVYQWENDEELNSNMRGILGVGVFSLAFAQTLRDELALRDPELHEHVYWSVVEQESGLLTFSSAADEDLNYFQSVNDRQLLFSKVHFMFGRSWVLSVAAHTDWHSVATADDPDTVIAVGTCFAVIFAALIALSVWLLQRSERLRTKAAEAKQQAAEAQASATELLLGYVNHEVRNPLNVLVASLEFVEEAILRWSNKLRPHVAQAARAPSSKAAEGSTAAPNFDFPMTPPETKDTETPNTPTIVIPPSATRPYSDLDSDLIVPHKDAQVVLRDLAAMRVAANQMERQVNEMLDFQQLKQGKIEIRNAACDLARSIRRLVGEHRVLTRVPIEFNVKFPSSEDAFPNPVWTDEMRFQQLLSNGLTNAIKFTKSGAIHVTLEASIDSTAVEFHENSFPPDFDRRGTISLSVKDSGEGLNGVDVEQLFRPFFTTGSRIVEGATPANTAAGGSRKRVLRSTGLGLSICRIITSQMNGTVELKDTGSGCLFHATIPTFFVSKKKPSYSSLPISPAESTTVATPVMVGAPLRVLVVDDMPNNVRLASRILTGLGCTAEGIHNPNTSYLEQLESRLESTGQMALNSSDSATDTYTRPFDIIFLDVMLGEENGFDILESIAPRLLDGKPWVVAMSAVSDDGDQEFQGAGFQGSVPKPFSSKVFLRILKCYQAGLPDAWGN